MQRRRSYLLLVVVAALAATFGFFAQRHVNGDTRDPTGVGQQRVDFALPDSNGKERSISEWDGKVIVLNFWATWCPPCRKEIPDFVALQSKYGDRGAQFIGVAMDRRDEVREFIREVPINYPTLIGDEQGEITRRYGNDLGALPYTVVIDRNGKVAASRRGVFPPEELEAAVSALL